MRYLNENGLAVVIAACLASLPGCESAPPPGPERSVVLDPAAATWADMLERTPLAPNTPEADPVPESADDAVQPADDAVQPEDPPPQVPDPPPPSVRSPSPTAPTRPPSPGRTHQARPEATYRPPVTKPAPTRAATPRPPQVSYGRVYQAPAGYYLAQPMFNCPGRVCPR